MLSNNKKLSPLCILEVLKESSDENHPLKQEQIIQKLYNRFGLELERKSVGATIDSLIDFGFDIVKTRNGCYLGEREFEKSEIHIWWTQFFQASLLIAHIQENYRKNFRIF